MPVKGCSEMLFEEARENIRNAAERINLPTIEFFDFFPKFCYIISMTQCIFCQIVRGDSPAEILYHNDHAIAILDINPIHYGHALIIAKAHCKSFLEVPEEAHPDLMRAARVVSQAIVDSFQPGGFNIFSNNGKAAGQTIFHFHFHITPRYADDNIRFVLELKKYKNNDVKEYADRLRERIGL